MTTTAEMPTRAVAAWFGAARLIAAEVRRELVGCNWVGVPFAGGMSELAEITASSLVVSDLHRHVINLARVIGGTNSGSLDQFRTFARLLANTPFHPDVLARAQAFCKENEPRPSDRYVSGIHTGDANAAYWYFIACWMGRSHKAGTEDEFNGGLSMRRNANGGDSNVRYRSAIRSLLAWRQTMRRCSFHVLDAFDFLEMCDDEPDRGIYCDPPFPGPGEKYRHKFDESKHRLLAAKLATFRHARVVCRFYDHPLIRELYPEPHWTWRHIAGGRTQTNDTAPEVLILNGPSRAFLQTGSLF